MNYEFYKTIHYISLAGLVVSLILIIFTQSQKDTYKNQRKTFFIFHGLSWLLLFISAFGLVSALDLHANFPNWARAKTLIWILLGFSPLLFKKLSRFTVMNTFIVSLLMSIAIYLAVYKPF